MTADPTDPSRSVWVATDADNALVRITGRASFSIGPALKQLGTALIDRQYGRFVLDMAECDGVDSTFLGILAGLALRIKKTCGGTIIMINLPLDIHENVCLLGLNRIIDCHEAGKCPDDVQESLGRLSALNRLDIGQVDAKTTRKTTIEAHEALISSDERNLPRFKDVLTFLRETSDTRK